MSLRGHENKGKMLNTASQYDALYRSMDYNEPGITGSEDKWRHIVKQVYRSHDNTASVIDVGCGRGFYIRRLKSMGHPVYGIEQSEECSKKYLSDIMHSVSTISEFFQFRDSHDLPRFGWDIMICTDVLEHIPEEEVDANIQQISTLSSTAIIGIANHTDKDPITGGELHLIQKNSDWWLERLAKAYTGSIGLVAGDDRFFIFRCEAKNP